ncbi:MAG TPA: response regulator [Candidatus Synoicihabitans sp.]|nr:response regulator [Candidatus Synoicihabitans sp.]
MLTAHPEIEICGEARDGEEALTLIRQLTPDLVFLDIQMPGWSGFELLARLDDHPQVILTTAFDRHAVQAFEANAIGYLLKPISPTRLATAWEKLRPRVHVPLDRVFVREGDRCWLVSLTEIVLLDRRAIIRGCISVRTNR